MTAVLSLGIALLLMAFEQQRSRRNEAALRGAGAVEPAGDVYRAMAWVYPGAFVAMAAEGWWRGPAPTLWIGIAIFVAAKALKYWAIAALGWRWTFRVLVPPAAPMVAAGPYAWLRHPNYVAVIGELIGFAAMVEAPVTGVVTAAIFGWLLRRRITVEEQALKR